MQAGQKRGLIQGTGSGFKQFVAISAYALAFWAGAEFIAQGELTFDAFIRVFLAITLAAEGIGRVTAQAPDRSKAQAAARSVYHQVNCITALGRALLHLTTLVYHQATTNHTTLFHSM
jgi:ATP-binding cassette subfamily B (MDR/TAP) protein 1